MHRTIEEEIRALREKLLAMGGFVEKAIEDATEALIERKTERLKSVFEYEQKINAAHLAMDEGCVKLLARQSPLAADLRMVVSMIKINTDLERMGDQAVNIAHNARHYLEGGAIKPLIDLPKMALAVRGMVRDALDAFVTRNTEKAQAVLVADDDVDGKKDRIFRDVTELMKADPSTVDRGLNLILIARNLERVGDHATNIAEDVIYAASGRDIRHQKGAKTE